MREIQARTHPAPWATSWSGQQGVSGEDEVAACLRVLDDGYVLVRNMTLPGSPGDVDGVLFTPPGEIWVLEIKTLSPSRNYRCHDLLWEYQATPSGGWRPLDTQPSRQALFHARQIKGALRDHGLPSTPRPIVVLAGEARVAARDTRVVIVTTRQLLPLVALGARRDRTHHTTAIQEIMVSMLLRAAQVGPGSHSSDAGRDSGEGR